MEEDDERHETSITGLRLDLVILDEHLAVCGPDRQGGIPSWATQGHFFSVTRTHDELSVVCPESSVPEGIRAEKGWRVLRVAGAMDFSVVGVLASLTVPLAEAGVALFALSTFDTDYVLVKEEDLGRAVECLTACGHIVSYTPPPIGMPVVDQTHG